MSDYYLGAAWGILIVLREWYWRRRLAREITSAYNAGRRDAHHGWARIW